MRSGEVLGVNHSSLLDAPGAPNRSDDTGLSVCHTCSVSGPMLPTPPPEPKLGVGTSIWRWIKAFVLELLDWIT